MTELNHRVCVDPTLIPDTTTPYYDTHHFAVQPESDDVAKIVHGLDTRSVDIARSSGYQRLIDFYIQFAALTDNAETMSRSCLFVGDSGSLVALLGSSRVVIGHVDDGNEPETHCAVVEQVNHWNGTTEQIYRIGSVIPTLRSVEDNQDDVAIQVERFLDENRAVDRQPRIHITPYAVMYLRSDGHWEMLNGLENTYARSRAAVRSGLAEVAIASGTAKITAPSGQYEEKMVV